MNFWTSFLNLCHWTSFLQAAQVPSPCTIVKYQAQVPSLSPSTSIKSKYQVQVPRPSTKSKYQAQLPSPTTKSKYEVQVPSPSTKFSCQVHLPSPCTKYQYKVPSLPLKERHTILTQRYLWYEASAFLEYVLVILLLPQLDEGVHAGQDRHGALLAKQGPDVTWTVNMIEVEIQWSMTVMI